MREKYDKVLPTQISKKLQLVCVSVDRDNKIPIQGNSASPASNGAGYQNRITNVKLTRELSLAVSG